MSMQKKIFIVVKAKNNSGASINFEDVEFISIVFILLTIYTEPIYSEIVVLSHASC